MKNIFLVSLVGALALTACSKDSTPVTMTVTTTLPTSVGATEDLPIIVEGINGCTFFKEIDVLSRTDSVLRLKVSGEALNPCPAVPNAAAFRKIYIDKTTTPRINLFEVWVNGNKAGAVEIK